MLISNLPQLRRLRRVTQKQVGDACGISQGSVAQFEKHGIVPRAREELVIGYSTTCGVEVTLDILQRLQTGRAVELDVPAEVIGATAAA